MDHQGWLGAARPLLDDMCVEWDKAEEQIKLAEQVCDSIVLPSINELRYAGRRLVDAVIASSTGDDRIHNLIADAKFNCHRARHDAIDAATSKIAGDIDAMLKILGIAVVIQCFPRIHELRALLANIRDRIVASRGKREDRDAIYATISTVNFPALVQLHIELMISEAAMIEIARAQRRDKLRNNVFGWGGLAFGLAGFATAIAAWTWPHLLGG